MKVVTDECDEKPQPTETGDELVKIRVKKELPYVFRWRLIQPKMTDAAMNQDARDEVQMCHTHNHKAVTENTKE